MFKNVLLVGLAGAALFAGSAQAQDRGYGDDRGPDNVRLAWADVLRVDPVYENVVSERPREECYDTEVERRDTRGNNGAGTVIGAIVGGALGNQVGKGDGRKAATVAGALIGGAIGNNAARRDDRYYGEPETRCRTVSERYSERRIVGYDVQYRYRGDVFMSHLDYDPGERMRVRVSVSPAE
ncbi:MAG: glycine zipper 2TM domain-containing protein [Dokdonella sp.]|nr:glycine zipper 2TM domain-containing protein [Dokdonella sp.]MCB1570335.1 glycine zipper 2TM domain-containing protein [Xanthomonadales bacterium]MCB1572867.1 glycine zipper 2TM domain-containing protein [Xanthomonadales bacterium]MCB1576474.1 glycine zipper 2TM domain-containing protein [Xanthomonadales bacterium]